MGRASLVFLKWQFKHSSMSITQLYASNPLQDASLFDEILAETTEFKADLIESWLGDQPLSGGAGRKIMKTRVIALENRTALLTQTAAQVHVRAAMVTVGGAAPQLIDGATLGRIFGSSQISREGSPDREYKAMGITKAKRNALDYLDPAVDVFD